MVKPKAMGLSFAKFKDQTSFLENVFQKMKKKKEKIVIFGENFVIF
jgi:hypothetical protein